MNRNLRIYGRPVVPEQRRLRAGPLTLVYEEGDLRYVSHGDVEVARRVYGAVRDGRWRTVPGTLSEVRLTSGPDCFRLRFTCVHREDPVHFVWQGDIEGFPDGTITFGFVGSALSRFERNRIGLCVLHPIRECAGRRADARHTDGTTSEVAFPTLVAVEQPVQGFTRLTGLAYVVPDAGRVDWTFEGDAFETEDQRNWIDASFKTYSTPLGLPRPVVVEAGTRVEQRVTLRWTPAAAHRAPSAAPLDNGPVALNLLARAPMAMPALGLMLGRFGAPPADAVRRPRLRPAHVRVDLDVTADWGAQLRRARSLPVLDRVPWELAIHVGVDSRRALDAVGQALASVCRIARVLVFSADRAVVSAADFAEARERIERARPDTGPWVAACRTDLYGLHLNEPPAADWLAWAVNPQAHASDPTSIMETPGAAGDQVRSVLERRPGASVAITPLTLGSRDLAPTDDDPIYESLLAATWFMAIAIRLSAARAASITFLDRLPPVAWAGAGAPPLLQVLADLLSANGRLLMPFGTDDADVTAAVVAGEAAEPGSATVLAANPSRAARSIELPAGMTAVDVRALDESSIGGAATDRAVFRRRKDATGGRVVPCGPLGIVRASVRLDPELRLRCGLR